MKRSAFFINTSRGRMVDEEALADALRKGTIAGAGLDVHATEPRPTPNIFRRHAQRHHDAAIAGGSRQGIIAEIATVLDNCRAVLRGGRSSTGYGRADFLASCPGLTRASMMSLGEHRVLICTWLFAWTAGSARQ